MTSREAYDKTEKLLEGYANGDLHGGNPMQYIEKYTEKIAIGFSKWKYEEGWKIFDFEEEELFYQNTKSGETKTDKELFSDYLEYLKTL